jgi:hypothetical protein
MLDRGFNPINLFHPVIVRNVVPVPSKDLDFQSPIYRGKILVRRINMFVV